MYKAVLLLSTLLFTHLSYSATSPASVPSHNTFLKQQTNVRGLPIFIQVFKEERKLELYVKSQQGFQLYKQYDICKFSGGLGPKRVQGDLKSPEGFYQASLKDLNPNSRFHKSINVGYPNSFDRANGYSGDYLMIHGKCESVGCYAMTNQYIEEIYGLVEAALRKGQASVPIHIYPFKMTESNMQRHRNSSYLAFWQQLKPGYDYFQRHAVPASIVTQNAQYLVQQDAPVDTKDSQYAFTKTE